jgi:hypothetical protein
LDACSAAISWLLAKGVQKAMASASKPGRNKVSSERDIQRLLKGNTSQLPMCRTKIKK